MATNHENDTTGAGARGVRMPDDPRRNPREAVDALDERVFGESPEQADEDARDEEVSPAFEQDLDPEDQGSAEEGAPPSG